MTPLGEATIERLVDAVACAIYEAGCFAYYGGDVGMTYWEDLSDEGKANDREQARELIVAALTPEIDGGDRVLYAAEDDA